MGDRQEFARLTQEIMGEVLDEEFPGQSRSTTRKVKRALRMARDLVEEEAGYRTALHALERMKRRRS